MDPGLQRHSHRNFDFVRTLGTLIGNACIQLLSTPSFSPPSLASHHRCTRFSGVIEPPLPVEALNVQLTGQAAESEPEPEPAVAAGTITNTTAMTTAAAETETPPLPPTLQPSDATTDPPHVPMPTDQSGAAAAEEEEEEDDDGPGAIAVYGEEIVADITDKVTSMVAVHAFEGGQAQGQLTMAAGEIVELLNTHIAEGWSWVQSSSGAEGYVPEGYLESA